ncbi:ATP-binding cassette domain-containing protein [Pontimicrobium aquaticum]|uniref:ABC transporter ATP-binding protein n=1 Tax=Pontimicrobium aquaticum TaxID=2565367 RepID=A0A4U0EZ07_9FLAO|nr:ABC transporter ATP-binding protein [Pontimicrobium aquaticum]TJY37286.1 ABC transporter ATP-binding protein [Pontimicrobium aquaticum]
MILEIDNVELNYNSKRILNGIYLKAETGKVVGILGSNGCGKTSLLNIIFGNIQPKYKLVRIDNKPILKPLYLTKLVKYLPQHLFLPKLKLINIFKLFYVSWQDFILEFPAFEKYKKTKVNKLSGGEQRIVEIYLVLKSNSNIVLLDEPFSHLAPLQVDSIKKIIIHEKRYKAIIITDHMYSHIIETSDDIYLIKNGCSKKINNINELKDYEYLSQGSLT